jgi:phosphatidylinositol kinase/protein kinase (PI-3  family)
MSKNDPKAVASKFLSITQKKLGNSPLSIEDQIEKQLKIATNPKNLGRMYYGWAAFY